MEKNNSDTVTLKLEKGHLAAIAIALIVVSSVTVGYFILNPSRPAGYSEMYLLDSQNQAVNYPQLLVANQNSTFNAQLFVVNRDASAKDFQVQVKIVQETLAFPVDAPVDDSYQFNLASDQTWSKQVPISINELGTYSVVFELYYRNGESYVFSDNFVVLHLDVVSDSA